MKENDLRTEYTAVRQMLEWLAKKLTGVDLYHGVVVRACTIGDLPFANGLMQPQPISKPKRYYANDREGNGKYDEQLKRLGPYIPPILKSSNLNVVVVTPRIHEGTVDDFVKKVRKNLESTFGLRSIQVKTLLVDNQSADGYLKTIYEWGFTGIDCAIVIVSEGQRHLPIPNSPYYVAKAKYIGQGIPTQEVQIEKIKSPGLPYIAANIALSLFAKLGGTPWAIEKTEAQNREIIVGIGGIVRDNRVAMGIANIFDHTGKYFVGDCVPLLRVDEYASALEDTVFRHLSRLTDDDTEVRVIFHIFKSASSRYEVKAMSNVVERLKPRVVKYAFVHVSYGHNFRLFNDDGRAALTRGLYLGLSDNDALVNFVDKSSIPLRVTIDKRSSFHDLYHVARQLYAFCHLSYRGYLPGHKPVTILYPSLMARLTDQLKDVPGWDYHYLESLGEKIWFI